MLAHNNGIHSEFWCQQCPPFPSTAMSPVVHSNVDNVRVVSTPRALPLSAISCLQLIKTSWFILGRRQIRGRTRTSHPPRPTLPSRATSQRRRRRRGRRRWRRKALSIQTTSQKYMIIKNLVDAILSVLIITLQEVMSLGIQWNA